MKKSRVVIVLAVICTAAIPLMQMGGCADDRSARMKEVAARSYPPPPQPARVVALGNLRSGPAAGETTTRLSLFLFGEEPEPPMGFLRPISVEAAADGLWACDAALGAVLRWTTEAKSLAALDASPRPTTPTAIALGLKGELFVVDTGAASVLRFNPASGQQVLRYAMGSESIAAGDPFRPSGVVSVGTELWVSNVAAHRIEVFDLERGTHVRSIGRRGAGPTEFGMPLGMALTPDGNIAVVDMLNCRVQVLDRVGSHVRDVGGPGDRVGRFGRPRDVAVGPDGVIFVTDAASQRVHAFDAQGRALLAFGEPGSSIGALSVPGGITVSRQCPVDSPGLPESFAVDYYVLIAEQLLRPGIRVYAWGRTVAEEDIAHRQVSNSTWRAAAGATGDGAGKAVNPHWSVASCGACHAMDGGRPQVIAAAQVDAACVACHDGRRAKAEAHPIGRMAATAAGINVPAEWPLVEGRLSCLTCHDIRRHCDAAARRPMENPAMLRVHDPDEPMRLCLTCHQPAEPWRISPHRNLRADGGADEQSCRFCHTEPMPSGVPGARRTGDAKLHVASSKLCLSCHTRHWDVSPRGHIERPATHEIVMTMLARERFAPGVGPIENNEANGGLDGARRAPQRLPLVDDKVTCFTCHNPHQRGLFPGDTPLGAHSDELIDAHAALRVNSLELCLECHAK